MNSRLFMPRIYERKIRCVRTLLHVAPLNGGNLIVPRLMGVLKASVPLFIDVTDEKRVADIATTDFNRSPFKSERSPIFRRIGASIPPLLLY